VLDLFHDGLRDAISGNLESDSFDPPLLQTYETLKRVLRHGVEEIVFGGAWDLRVDISALDSVRELGLRVPNPRHVRVSGKLDQIQHSDRRFVLTVAGTSLRGVAGESIELTELGAMFGKRVIATGDAIFRPSGSVLRIDATRLELAGSGASVWEKLPRPLFENPPGASCYRVPQTPETGLGALIGRWPGDESDEELMAAMDSLG